MWSPTVCWVCRGGGGFVYGWSVHCIVDLSRGVPVWSPCKMIYLPAPTEAGGKCCYAGMQTKTFITEAMIKQVIPR